ncbi:MAG: hypothetical protein EOP47_09320 [Sphingobacteriaceae bacterium]|nr:MAG: hypothetical protein EOP47_09320 [Sphingobacteriaceae bacterium]
MKKRSYKITFALKEGYAPNGRVHNLKYAGKIIHNWMADRLDAQLPVVNGFLQEGILFFPSVEKSNADPVTASPSAVYFGELSSPEDMKRNNKEIRETLESLARVLLQKLKQESVYIIYHYKNWCVGKK